MVCRPLGSSIHGILQAITLEWAAMPFSWGSSLPRNWTLVSCITGRFFFNPLSHQGEQVTTLGGVKTPARKRRPGRSCWRVEGWVMLHPALPGFPQIACRRRGGGLGRAGGWYYRWQGLTFPISRWGTFFREICSQVPCIPVQFASCPGRFWAQIPEALAGAVGAEAAGRDGEMEGLLGRPRGAAGPRALLLLSCSRPACSARPIARGAGRRQRTHVSSVSCSLPRTRL